MHSTAKISFREALQLIDACVFEAEKINKHISISIAGPEGEMIAFLRMDSSSPAASKIARNKAYTAACDRKTTREMGEFMNSKQRPPAFWGDHMITGFGGGVPVFQNNLLIGGIGVSGLSEDEDERICHAAIQKVYV